jgi:Protein of unknown function (DUF998)
MVRKLLLVCGIASALFYAALNVYVPLQWAAYSAVSQTVSELSAISAPTRALWVRLVIPYGGLLIAFGCGVWLSAGRGRALRVTGAMMIAQGVMGFYWPPMHLRGAEMTLTDTLHIVWAAVTVLFMAAAIGFGAAALGRGFRRYSIATVVIFLLFGTLTGLDGPKIAADLPTPWIGIWERINIGAFLLWVVVLAVALMRAPGHVARATDSGA